MVRISTQVLLAGGAAAVFALGACSSSSTQSGASPTASPTPSVSATGDCTLDKINADLFPADAGAASATCLDQGGVRYAGGTTGPTAAGVTGQYLAILEGGKWKLYTGPCTNLPPDLQQYCPPSASPSASKKS